MKNIMLTIFSFWLVLNVSAQINYASNIVNEENYSSALGLYNTSTGTASFASGYNSQAIGIYSTALGHTATATGMHSLALGSFSTAEGPGSVAIGPYALVNSNASMGVAIGNLVESHMPSSFIIGTAPNSSNKFINNISNSLMIGFNSSLPTLFISGSGGQESTGKIGIGDVTDPQAKLHIKADHWEQASLFIEPYSFSASDDAELWMGTEEYGLRAAYGKMFFNTGGNYLFNSADANVGIGVLNPLAKLQVNGDVFIEDENSGLILKSPDGQCWKIAVNNNGELITNSINCDLTTGNSNTIQSEKEIIRIYPNPTKDLVTIENNYSSPVFATLRDLNGTLIITQKLQFGDNNLNLHDLTTGYYMVTILDNNNQVISSEKIMKK